MSKKYLQIIAFSILCFSGATQEARAQALSTCCATCVKAGGGQDIKAAEEFLMTHLGAAEAYAMCIRLNCPEEVCPTLGQQVSIEGQCGKCIKDNLQNGPIDFSAGSSYAKCIKQNNNHLICPDAMTQPAVYDHLKP